MTHLTQLEASLAASPAGVSRDVGEKLDIAHASLARALRTPLTPAQHAQVQAQMLAVDAAAAILRSMARRYGTSYGQSS